MAYGLPRTNTVESVLRGSCYEVQEPWELALLTKTWYTNIINIKLPFLEEITFGNPLNLKKHKTIKDNLLPSIKCVKFERDCEMKRLNNLKHQKKIAEEVQFSLRKRPVGLRRPLPPK